MTREGGVLLGPIWLEGILGLETSVDAEPEVVVDVGTVVIFEGITGADDSVTVALAPAAAEVSKGL